MSHRNPWAVQRALKELRALQSLAAEFWSLEDQGLADPDALSEKQHSAYADLKQRVDKLVARLEILGGDVGISFTAEAHPPPVIAGRAPVERFNLFLAITDREIGYGGHGDGGGDRRAMIRARMTQMEVHLEEIRRRAILRLILPWYWLVDIPALIVRFPFLVLEAAGLPSRIEEHIISQVVKGIVSVVLAVGMSLLLAYLGLERLAPDLAKSLFGG